MQPPIVSALQPVLASSAKLHTPVAQHTALVRRVPQHPNSHTPVLATTMAELVCASLAQGPSWDKARLLVDSGSEHPPLISTRMAKQLGLEGQVVSAATQANGDVLPLSDVGSLELCINGLPITEQFLSAPLSHYDIILGESWLRHHRGIMDYAHDQLWQLLPSGPVPLNFDILPPGDISCPHLKPSPTPYVREILLFIGKPMGRSIIISNVTLMIDHNLAAMVTEGCQLAQQPWLQLPVPPTQYTKLERQQLIFNTLLQPHLRTVHFGGTWIPPTPSCARVHRQEKKKSSLAAVHRLGDVGKELPEDAEILDFLDADIPGLSTNSERSFDFVTSEVRTQLAHLPAQQVEDILSLLGGFENTVLKRRQCHGCHQCAN